MKLQDIGFLEVIDDRITNFSPGKISYCEWFITANCNFSCPYCNHLKDQKAVDPSWQNVIEIISTLSGVGCKYIHLTGGEPTTRQDLFDIIKEIKSHNIRVGISTNGSKPIEYYYKLVTAGVELFSISLDIHRRELNHKFTLVHNVFDLVVNNIRELSKLVYVNVGTVFTEENIEYYNDIIKFISDLGVSDIKIGTDTKYNKLHHFDIPEEILIKHPVLRFRTNNFNMGRNMRGSELGNSRKCYLVLDDVTIAGGECYPCAVYVRENGNPIGPFDKDNETYRRSWFESHDSYTDPICRKFCMDFKCKFNEKANVLLGKK
jgi:MoaA/NifB/PqqE/SkfB family radical SAM enzyme